MCTSICYNDISKYIYIVW